MAISHSIINRPLSIINFSQTNAMKLKLCMAAMLLLLLHGRLQAQHIIRGRVTSAQSALPVA